jgi:hypothetical protein
VISASEVVSVLALEAGWGIYQDDFWRGEEVSK